MLDALIIGGGPAGLSAALYLRRGGRTVQLISRDGGSLARAGSIDNYFGMERAISGQELLEIGRAQAVELGAGLTVAEVLDVQWDGGFSVSTTDRTIQARSVLLAAGAVRKALRLPGAAEFEGRGVSYCAVCDAFFYRGKEAAVLGGGEYAMHELSALQPVAGKAILLTGGGAPEVRPPEGIEVIEKPLRRLLGDQVLTGVEFEDGTTRNLSGLFVALGSAGAGELARKLGVPVKDGNVVVNADMSTAIPGFFAAGDCIGGLRQVAAAVGQGAVAAMSMLQFLRK